MDLVATPRMSAMLPSTPPLVGRDAELDRLERSLQEAIEGRPQVVLLCGEAGIGKTRLLQELQAIAKRCRVQVCSGRCSEDFSLPYQPFTDGLFPRLAATISEATGGDADTETLRHFLRPSADPATGSESTQHNKLRLFGAVARATIRLARRAPLLLVADDLHWADRASLDLLTQIVFGVADSAGADPVSLMIIGAHRPVEPEHPLARAIARLQPETVCQTLELSGLVESDVEALLGSLGDARPPHRLVSAIAGATQGNPLFVQQAFYHLSEQGGLQGSGAEALGKTGTLELPFPEQLVGAITARAQGLGADCRRVLVLGALFGDRFPLDALSAAAGSSSEQVAALLDEAVRQRLLVAEGEAFAFAHPLIRHVFFSEPSAPEKQRLHRCIAQALEGLHAGNLDAHLLEIAHHWVGAGPEADVHKVVAYARRAGDQAFTLFAWNEAAHSYERALAAAESISNFSVRDRAELYYRAGLAHYRDMNGSRSIEHYGKAVDAYGLVSDVRGLAQTLVDKTRAHLTLAAVPYGTLLDVQPLEAALGSLGEEEPKLRGRIWEVLSDVYWTARQPDKAQAMAQQALEIGEQLGDGVLCAESRTALGSAQLQRLELPEALASLRKSLEAARRTNDLWIQGWPLHRIPAVLTCLGQLDEAESAAHEALALTRTTFDWAEQSLALAALSNTAVAKGDIDAVERYVHEAMIMVSRSRYPWGGPLFIAALASARAMRGAWGEATDAIDMLVEPGRVFEEAGPIFHVIAWVYRELLRAQEGTTEGSAEQLTGGLLAATQDAGLDIGSLPIICALVEIADQLGYPPLAGPAFETLSLAAERGVVFSSAWMFLVPRLLAVAAMLNGWWDKAERHFHVALDAATGSAARPELGRSCLDYARMLVARNASGDRDHARDRVRQAGGIFAEFGMAPLAQRATRLAQALGAPIDARLQQLIHPNGLTKREIDILVALGRGRTDPGIADDLLLSPHTVAGYVNSILRKIGAEDRTAAAAYARDSGLLVQTIHHTEPKTQATRPQSAAAEPTRPYRPLSSVQPIAIVFTDMEGSTALIERLGDTKAQEVLRTHNAIVRACLRRHHGVEIKHTGDGVMASFSSAASAVECAVTIQQAIAQHNVQHPNDPIHVRIGVNAGEPIAEEGQLFGSAVNVAARLCDRAHPAQILVSDVVRRLLVGKDIRLIDRGELTLKGFSGRFRVYEVPW